MKMMMEMGNRKEKLPVEIFNNSDGWAASCDKGCVQPLVFFFFFLVFSLETSVPFFFFKILFILERGEGKEKERSISVWLPLKHPSLATWPTTRRMP